MVSTISLFVSAHYGFILFVNAVVSSFVFAVPSLFYMVLLWLKWKIFLFSLRSMVSKISLFYGCNHLFFCLSNVQASVYGFNGFLFFLCALWFQWFLPFKHAVISSFVLAVSLLSHMIWSWFWWESLPFYLRSVVSMISSFYGCRNFFLCLSGVEESVYGLNDFFFSLCALWFQVLFSLTRLCLCGCVCCCWLYSMIKAAMLRW